MKQEPTVGDLTGISYIETATASIAANIIDNTITVSAAQPAPEPKSPTLAASLENHPTHNQSSTAYYLKGILFLGFIAVISAIVQYFYSLAHGINLILLFSGSLNQWNFNWLGGRADPSSVGIEILIWTIMGVSAKMAYQSADEMLRGTFSFLPSVINWISKSFYAWGIGVATVLFFSVVSITIAGFEITLANASIGSIIAIAFIIGFYDSEALSVLEKLRRGLVTIIDDWGKENKNQR